MRELADISINIPVYFARDSIFLKNLVLKSKEKKEYTVIVNANEPTPIEDHEVPAYFGVFSETEEELRSEKPIILLSATYDQTALAPRIVDGVDAASGFLALNDIARTLRSLFDDPSMKEKAEYEVIFMLTPGAQSDYQVTENWLKQMNTQVSDRIALALCLDHLGSGEKLTLHLGGTQNDE